MGRSRKSKGKQFSSTHQPDKKGMQPFPPELREASKLTKARLRGMINKHLWMTQDEHEELGKNRDAPMIETLISSIVQKAVIHGDERKLNFILDRMIGKVKEEIDIKAYMSQLAELKESEIITLGAEAVKFLKESE